MSDEKAFSKALEKFAEALPKLYNLPQQLGLSLRRMKI